MALTGIPVTLVDARNIDALEAEIMAELATAPMVGYDIESEDSEAHAGILEYRKNETAKCFDFRRMRVTGFSTHVPGSTKCYYFNVGHADVENRIPWSRAEAILACKPATSPWVIHNAVFERIVMRNDKNMELGDVICTLQLAVSAFGPDEYQRDQLGKLFSWPLVNLIPRIANEFATFDRYSYEMTTQQAKLLGKVVAKESTSEDSYNGFNREIAWGYGLKGLVRKLLGGEIGDFKELLAKFGAKHMGELTGEQAAQYGGDDAYWCVQVLYKLLGMIKPEALKAYQETEVHMSEVFSRITTDGCRIDHDEVKAQFIAEKQNRIDTEAQIKDLIQAALPFPEKPHAELAKREDWYAKNYKKYRKMLVDWKRDDKKPINLTHYMVVRTVLYDLFGLPVALEKGKVQSDGETRGQLMEKATGGALEVLKAMGRLAGIDQRVKLFLSPYSLLIDPETDKIYPQVSCMLATRRLAGSNPNPMQLAKGGDAAYIRGFYLPDNEDDLNPFRRKKALEFMDQHGISSLTETEAWRCWRDEHNFDPRHGIMSIDLSQIELVLIGEFSGDSKFAEAYGQLPYNDLHQTAGASILAALTGRPDFTREDFLALREGKNEKGIPLVDVKGRVLTPEEAYKYNRGNDGGKSANFEFWYSGHLGTLAERRGLKGQAVNDLVQGYVDAFPEAVQWRQNIASDVQLSGEVILPDGHRRVRYEATHAWQATMRHFFRSLSEHMDPTAYKAVEAFADIVVRKISRRAQNQLINALIQGSCAAIIKRSILGILRLIDQFDARFMFPVHDELVFSVNYQHMLPFMRMAKPIMQTHPDFISKLVMNSSTSIGRTFQKFDVKKAPFGQIELDEAPKGLSFIPASMIDKPMDNEHILKTVEYLHG